MTCFHNNYAHFSPAVGAAFSHGKFLYLLQNALPEGIATRDLARELFFAPTALDPVRVTTNKSKPAAWMTPRDIGVVVALLHHLVNPENKEPVWEYVVKVPFFSLSTLIISL